MNINMIFIVIDRCVECGDKVDRKNLILGLCEGCQIEQFFDIEFGERLSQGFVMEYERLKKY